MIVVIGLIAFIVNIGYFVKAKINLQNAVDAAAIAGASVQARQLTNIGYLNWEMRNTYKEWMFKYYVLGNLNTDAIKVGSTTTSDFRMKDINASGLVSTGGDRYNVPSICVDFANIGNVGICRNYKVPGLPRFEAYDVQGMTETTNAMIDAIVSEKNGDCAKRSALNFSTATLWAYNIVPKPGETSSLITDSPQIATNRPGAFPAAFELALRMRNLEAQVNKEPNTAGVCMGTSSLCSTTINTYVNDDSPAHERITKAFMSAWRNIGGMATDDLLKSTFTLKELAPNVFNGGSERTLSNLLIPGNSKASQKYYLDLKLQTINFATFYTAFVSRLQNDGSTPVEGECEATKIGLPVPGYPLGFVKNPNVVTYYAVQGEGLFVGLFNPFDFGEGIKLTAVAAAKPFGARIGPSLFDVTGDQATKILPLTKGGIFVSSAYAVGVEKTGANKNTFIPGDALPLGNFWQSNQSEAIGGWVSGDIRFVMPNLIYDYPNGISTSNNKFLSTTAISVIKTNAAPDANEFGLYNGDMLKDFTSLLNISGGLTPDQIDSSILASRAATFYDLNNYLVPTPEELNQSLTTNSYGFIAAEDTKLSPGDSPAGYDVYNYNIYAPIFDDNNPDVLFKNTTDLDGVLDDYISNQQPAIEQYLKSMKLTASNIYTSNTSGNSGNDTAVSAANIIADIPLNFMASDPENPGALVSCKSIAGKFAYFYSGSASLVEDRDGSCATREHLRGMLKKYWNNNQSRIGKYYETQFVITNQDQLRRQHFNAYNSKQDPDGSNGVFLNSIRGRSTNMYRNYYSSKLIALSSVLGGSQGYKPQTNFPIFSSGSDSNDDSVLPQTELSNALTPDEYFNKINH